VPSDDFIEVDNASVSRDSELSIPRQSQPNKDLIEEANAPDFYFVKKTRDGRASVDVSSAVYSL